MSIKTLSADFVFYGVLDLRSHRLSFVSCAHPAPLVLHADGTCESADVSAHPIGMFAPGQAKFFTWEVRLVPGDRVLFVSDGVLEAPRNEPNDAYAPFGDERLEAVWRHSRALPFEDALSSVMDALAAWRGTGRIADDITILGLERTH